MNLQISDLENVSVAQVQDEINALEQEIAQSN